MSLQVVSLLDQQRTALNNEDVGKRAGKRIRKWRQQQEPVMNQQTFARLAHISVGSLQSFELGTRLTRVKNVSKIAAVLGLTAEQLMGEDDWPPEKPNALLKDLRQEDLVLANQFHHAGADAKYAVKALFNPQIAEDTRERIARVLDLLVRSRELLGEIEDLLKAWKRDGGA